MTKPPFQITPKILRLATEISRIKDALLHFGLRHFNRSDYCQLFPGISTATASRDLAQAVSQQLLRRSGDKSQTVYVAMKSFSWP